MFRLPPRATLELLDHPESGMGYQLVEIRWKLEDPPRRAVAFNAELLVLEQELTGLRAPFEELVERSETLNRDAYEELTVVPDHRSARQEPSYVAEGLPTAMIPSRRPRRTRDLEGFKRFSAYRKDRRVTEGNGLAAGSFTTSTRDIRLAPSGYAAVGRYALPNPWPAVYVCTVVPGASVRIEVGTVLAAFGQAGGGVEVLFVDPTGPGCVIGPYAIPEI